MKFPDLTSMLPSQAKSALEEYIFLKIKEQGVDSYNRVEYRAYDARVEVHSNEYVQSIVDECYARAFHRFEREHPLCWDNEAQRSYRKGINEPVHVPDRTG